MLLAHVDIILVTLICFIKKDLREALDLLLCQFLFHRTPCRFLNPQSPLIMLNPTLDEETNPRPSLLSRLNLEQDENLTLFEPSLLSVEPMTNNQPISSTPSSPNVEPDPSPKPSLLERFSTALMDNIPFLQDLSIHSP